MKAPAVPRFPMALKAAASAVTCVGDESLTTPPVMGPSLAAPLRVILGPMGV